MFDSRTRNRQVMERIQRDPNYIPTFIGEGEVEFTPTSPVEAVKEEYVQGEIDEDELEQKLEVVL